MTSRANIPVLPTKPVTPTRKIPVMPNSPPTTLLAEAAKVQRSPISVTPINSAGANTFVVLALQPADTVTAEVIRLPSSNLTTRLVTTVFAGV